MKCEEGGSVVKVLSCRDCREEGLGLLATDSCVLLFPSGCCRLKGNDERGRIIGYLACINEQISDSLSLVLFNSYPPSM
jgi:hypothetical protein